MRVVFKVIRYYYYYYYYYYYIYDIVEIGEFDADIVRIPVTFTEDIF
jgi:hypothetical protein